MKLTFNVPYRTQWGESLYIWGGHTALGSGDPRKALRMNLFGEDHWSITVDAELNGDFSYGYIVKAENGGERREWGNPHTFRQPVNATVCEIFDHWQDMPADKPFYSSAFTRCINSRKSDAQASEPQAGMLTLRVWAPEVRPDQAVAVCGSCKALGEWNPVNALRMDGAEFPHWSINIPLNSLNQPCDFKFITIENENGALVSWENGRNRNIDHPVADSSIEAVVIDGLRYNSGGDGWRGAGTAIPVFSLRTSDDLGIGDFLDLKPMVEWAVRTGQNFIQLLPVNDTTMTRTWTDSYPYNANSTFALHPIYLRVTAIGTLHNKERMDYFLKLADELNSLKEIDYERVLQAKEAYCREIYAQEGPAVLASDDYRNFYRDNAHWLKPYAAFCVLRDRFNTPDFTFWGEYAQYSPEKVDSLFNQCADDINYWCFIQYHLDRQLRHVRDYAHAKGVAIKGDIPIGISRTSVDAWMSPRLFYLDSQAGAPPDDFSVLGQNWGFPTYNWDEMAKDGFAWWKSRFRKMAEYFDAYRIDHILGFFRIWQIPMHCLHGLLGVFHPALPFTPDELRNNYGFWIDTDLHTTPYIMNHFLGDFFGEHTEEVKERFLIDTGYGRYKLRGEYDTQRKVADYFASQEKNDKNDRICNGLLGLIDEVLFIEDPYEKGKYHPRITAQYTYIYRSLSDHEKWCFNRLYNDFYYHRNDDLWYGKAMWKLPPLIDATSMLTCAEDLGMIPGCVPAVLNNLEILSLEIQRMPKEPGEEFGNTHNYPYFSVCTTSTHDMAGIRAWWEEDHERAQRYFNNVLGLEGNAPYYAEPWICDHIVQLNLKSPSMLCILPLQDWLSIDGALRRDNPAEEQINVPANPRHYWRYRCHLGMDKLLGADTFNSYLRDIILSSGRR